MTGSNRETNVLRLLDAVESDDEVSQRLLSKELGIALGLTNLLVKRLVHKGWLRVVKIKPNRVRYLITPAGIVEKARLSRAYFDSSVQFYRDARGRIQQQFSALSSDSAAATRGGPTRVVFYGAGEVAEIAYICLADTDLQLVGIVDPARTKPFFGLRVCAPEQLDGLALNGQPFDLLVFMSFGNIDVLRAEALTRRVPLDRVAWL
jgi:hypothetical protein